MEITFKRRKLRVEGNEIHVFRNWTLKPWDIEEEVRDQRNKETKKHWLSN